MNARNFFNGPLVAMVALFAPFAATAEVRLNPLFADNAVLQCDAEVPVWGTARNGEMVTVEIQGQKVSVTAVGGKWLVRLKPLAPGGPFTLTVSGDHQITPTNILVGEVWLCGGQSNMEWALARSDGGSNAIATATNQLLRLCRVPHNKCEALRPLLEKYQAEKAAALAAKLPPPPPPAGLPGEFKGATTLWNGEVAPLLPYRLRGVAWYQGENNAYAQVAHDYKNLLPAMIRDWRSGFEQPELPFLIFQIARNRKWQTDPNEKSGIAELQEAQARTAQTTPHTALVVTTDQGGPDVHYRGKEPVAVRYGWADLPPVNLFNAAGLPASTFRTDDWPL